MPESIQFTVVELNQVMSRNVVFKAAGIDTVTLANSLGIYKSIYRPAAKSPRATAHYITTHGIKPSKMGGGKSKWYTTLSTCSRKASRSKYKTKPNEVKLT
jgi:hypothetical protein